jgi:hypothetical protein
MSSKLQEIKNIAKINPTMRRVRVFVSAFSQVMQRIAKVVSAVPQIEHSTQMFPP